MADAGAGDMVRAVYDSSRRDTDVFDYADTKATAVTYNVIADADDWSSGAPYTQMVSVSGILSSDNPIADIVLSSTQSVAEDELSDWSAVSDIVTADGSVTFKCFSKCPSCDLTVQLKVVR